MDPDAVLGPVDPQLGSPQTGYYPAASILKALEQPNREDHTIIQGDIQEGHCSGASDDLLPSSGTADP